MGFHAYDKDPPHMTKPQPPSAGRTAPITDIAALIKELREPAGQFGKSMILCNKAAAALRALAHQLNDESEGTPLGRLKAIADFAIANGLCTGTEGAAPETFVLDRLRALAQENERRQAVADHWMTKTHELQNNFVQWHKDACDRIRELEAVIKSAEQK